MEQKKVEVQKNGIIKKILKKDLKDFVACGWIEVKENINPFSYASSYKSSLK